MFEPLALQIPRLCRLVVPLDGTALLFMFRALSVAAQRLGVENFSVNMRDQAPELRQYCAQP
jgi:hypothetical protein